MRSRVNESADRDSNIKGIASITRHIKKLFSARVTLANCLVLSLCTSGALAQATGVEATQSKTSASKAPIKIGFITSLSGAAKPQATEMVNGIQLYLESVHYKLAGHPVLLLVENDGGDPATAMEKVRKLVDQDHVQVLDGLILANVGYSVAPLVDKLRVPTIYAVSAGDDLTQRQHHEWVVRTGWNSSMPSLPFGDWVLHTLHYKRVATLGMDYAFGWEVVGGFQKAFEDSGGQVVQKLWAPLGFTDFTNYINGLHKDADAVFINSFGTAAVIVDKQYKQLGPKLPMIGGGTSFDESVLRGLGDEAIGAISPMPYSAALETPANKKFVTAYRAKYQGQDPSWFAECGYTSGMFIDKAVQSLKGDLSSPKQFLDAIKSVQLSDAPRGPVRLDSTGNPIENIYVRKVERKNGRLQNTVIHTFKNVSQFWTYKPEEYLKQPAYSRNYPPCKFCTKSD
jgi:branched-chain amino acid transport system substrate-binding protein